MVDKSKSFDPVNQPFHYTYGDIDAIDAIESWKLGFHDGNIVKYLARYKHKGEPLQDLKKARWYLDRLIEIWERKNAKNTSKG